jgi:uncharacterized protein YkwD
MHRATTGGMLLRLRLLSVALALLACDSTGPGPEAPGSADPAVREFVDLANAHRETAGCNPLLWHEGTAAVAQAHSEDMVERDFFAHQNPDGESPFDRLREAGVEWSGGAGENIAWGYPTAAAVLAGWLGSPGHRANLENCGYTHHGVGLQGTHWTHVFITNPTP